MGAFIRLFLNVCVQFEEGARMAWHVVRCYCAAAAAIFAI